MVFPADLLDVLSLRAEEGAAHVLRQGQRDGGDRRERFAELALRGLHIALLPANRALQQRFVDGDVRVRAALNLLDLLSAVIQQNRQRQLRQLDRDVLFVEQR